MREHKKKYKLITNENCLLVAFDLENMITLLKANIGSFFYKRKLTFFNLTTMKSSKQGYCATWTEYMSSQAGNDIGGNYMQILNKVAADHLNEAELISWSGSCVPQNRNSHISQATLQYLSKKSKIKVATVRYLLAGHSCIQEVDKMHQEIEVAMPVAMPVAKFYSPLSTFNIF